MQFNYFCKNILKINKVAIPAIILALLLLIPLSVKGQQMTDTKITYAVENQLLSDEGVPAHLINVQTTDGVVSLTGGVDNLLAKDRAERVAETVKGVRSVINRIVVKKIDRSDEAIAGDATLALFEDPATEAYEIEVEVKGGKAVLRGTVQSRQEKMLAEKVVEGVRGVREIENDIEILYRANREDEEIRADVRRRLESDVWVDDNLIQVEVNDGKVILTGMVGSAAEYRAARRDAWVTGTKSVNTTMLEINWKITDDMQRGTKHAGFTDDEIETAIENAFTYDPRVSLFDITVSVDRNVATLIGTVDNLKARTAAEEDAMNTIGVRLVRNHIKVRPDIIPSNEELKARVMNALARDPYIDLFNIEVEAIDGKVALQGSVPTSYQKEHVEDVVRRVRGVVQIENMLDYRHVWTSKSDIAIEQDVEDLLYWQPFVNSGRIEVSVNNGVVTLKGEVDSWLEYTTAEKEAYEAGAKDVRNKLKISTYSMYELEEELNELDEDYFESNQK